MSQSDLPPVDAPQQPAEAAPPHPPREPVVHDVQREVTLQRSVRVTRLLIVGLVVGAVVAMIACLFFPVAEGAEYTLGQVVGFMALIGAAVGAAVGGLLAILLGFIARRQHGTGVAIQHDVR